MQIYQLPTLLMQALFNSVLIFIVSSQYVQIAADKSAIKLRNM